MSYRNMIGGIKENIVFVSLVTFGSLFKILRDYSLSENKLKSSVSKLVIGFSTVFILFPIINDYVDDHYQRIIIAGISANAVYIIDYVIKKTKEFSKSKIDNIEKENRL